MPFRLGIRSGIGRQKLAIRVSECECYISAPVSGEHCQFIQEIYRWQTSDPKRALHAACLANMVGTTRQKD
jgi:hypothetical protein